MNSHNILDTFLINEQKIKWFDYHLQRTESCLQFLGVKFNPNKLKNLYDSAVEGSLEAKKSLDLSASDPIVVRLEINPNHFSSSKVSFRKLTSLSQVRAKIILQPRQPWGVGTTNFKWAHRPFWDSLQSQFSKDIDDVICLNENNEFTELSRFNLFILDKDENLFMTPRLESGCLDGVYRKVQLNQGYIQHQLIEQKSAPLYSDNDTFELGKVKLIEQTFKYNQWLINESRYELWAGNSVRGLIPCQIITQQRQIEN